MYRPLPWILSLLAGAAPVACTCSESHLARDGSASRDAAEPDAGERDAGRDARVDAAVPLEDAGEPPLGDGGLVAWPDGWERVPFLPESCGAWRPRGDPAGAVRRIRFEPCDSPQPGCEQLAIEWERSRIADNALLADYGHQTWGERRVIAMALPFETRTGGGFYDWTMYTLEGTPLAVWRIRRVDESFSEGDCTMPAVALAGDRVAAAFDVLHGTHVHVPFEVSIIEGSLESIQRVDSPRLRLSEDDLLSVGNAPKELLYDGESLVILGELGSVYLGTLAGRPWGHLATCRTGDLGNGSGMLFDGALYWDGSPCPSGEIMRIRRRLPGAAENETFMQVGRDWLSNFRTDGTWAAWVHHVVPAGSLTPDHTDIWITRIDGVLDPARFRPRLASRLEEPVGGYGRPILSNGMYAYFVNDRALEVIDLGRGRKVRIQIGVPVRWQRLLYLGPEYVMATYWAGVGTWDGIHRFRLSEVEGWEPLPE